MRKSLNVAKVNYALAAQMNEGPATSHKSCGQPYKSLNLEVQKIHKFIVKFCILELT